MGKELPLTPKQQKELQDLEEEKNQYIKWATNKYTDEIRGIEEWYNKLRVKIIAKGASIEQS